MIFGLEIGGIILLVVAGVLVVGALVILGQIFGGPPGSFH